MAKLDLDTEGALAASRAKGIDALEEQTALEVAALQAKLQAQNLDANGRQAIANEIALKQKNLDLAREQAAVAQPELDAEGQLAASRARGLEAAEEEAALKIATLQKQRDAQANLTAQSRQEIGNRIAAEQKSLEVLRRQAAIQREADAAHLRILSLGSRATLATAQGRFGDAARLRDEKIRAEDAAANKESYEQKVSSGSYTAAQAREAVAAEQQAREQARATQRQTFLATNKRLLDEQQLAQSKDPADRRRAVGMKDEDKARERIGEALQSGATPREAAAYANRAGTLDLQKLQQEQGRNVIADSLARVGGGGGVAGADPMMGIQQRQADLLARNNALLEIIAANGSKGQETASTVTFPTL